MSKRNHIIRKRIDWLPILFEEMHSNLLNFDKLHNPIDNPFSEIAYVEGSTLQEELLILMKDVENLITTFVITGDYLFELNLEETDWVGRYGLTIRKIESEFLKINKIFRTSNLKCDHRLKGITAFHTKIKYSLDIELFLHFFGNKIHTLKYNPANFYPDLLMSDLKKRSLESSESKRRFIKKIEHTFSETITSDKPSLTDRRKLYVTSIYFNRKLIGKLHRSKLNIVNSNASARHKKAIEYVDGLFDYYKRLTFVATDLCFDCETDVDKQKEIFTCFKNGMRKHPVIKEMVGYIGKWEISLLKDRYVRMIFIFPFLSHSTQEQIIEIIGRYWKNHSIYGNKEGKFHSAKLASYPSQLDQTICSISQSHKRVRLEFEARTIFYLTHAQDHYSPKQNGFKETFFKGTLKHIGIDQ